MPTLPIQSGGKEKQAWSEEFQVTNCGGASEEAAATPTWNLQFKAQTSFAAVAQCPPDVAEQQQVAPPAAASGNVDPAYGPVPNLL